MIDMTPRKAPPRTMIELKPETRDRLNRFVALMCAVKGYKISQDTALMLLLDKYGTEVEQKGLAELANLN